MNPKPLAGGHNDPVCSCGVESFKIWSETQELYKDLFVKLMRAACLLHQAGFIIEKYTSNRMIYQWLSLIELFSDNLHSLIAYLSGSYGLLIRLLWVPYQALIGYVSGSYSLFIRR